MAAVLVAALQHHHEVAATQAVVAVDNALAKEGGDGAVLHIRVVHHIGELWVGFQLLYYLFLHFVGFQTFRLYKFVVEVDGKPPPGILWLFM